MRWAENWPSVRELLVRSLHVDEGILPLAKRAAGSVDTPRRAQASADSLALPSPAFPASTEASAATSLMFLPPLQVEPAGQQPADGHESVHKDTTQRPRVMRVSGPGSAPPAEAACKHADQRQDFTAQPHSPDDDAPEDMLMPRQATMARRGVAFGNVQDAAPAAADMPRAPSPVHGKRKSVLKVSSQSEILVAREGSASRAAPASTTEASGAQAHALLDRSWKVSKHSANSTFSTPSLAQLADPALNSKRLQDVILVIISAFIAACALSLYPACDHKLLAVMQT
jgi:hypothetical protein